MAHFGSAKGVDIPHLLLRIFLVLIAICGAVLIWRGVVWLRLPLDSEMMIPPPAEEEIETPPPPRPGVQGIIIMGAKIVPPVFEIDITKSRKSLNWRSLELIDPDTDVEIVGEIMRNGELRITRINDKGHPSAGRLIHQTLSTWVYTKFKTGPISFWFNLPSKGRRLIIDIRGLQISEDETASGIVKNGKLHLIDDLPAGTMGFRKR